MATTIANELVTSTASRRQRMTTPAGETSPWYPVAAGGGRVCVKPGAGGTARVQETGSPLSVVLADNQNGTSNAIAEDWDAGAVDAITSESFAHTTAVRFIATGAALIGEIAT